MPCAFVADCHLDVHIPDQQRFASFLDRFPDEAQTLVLMGDLFNLWVAFENYEEDYHRDVLDSLARARARGVKILFIEGNREFFVAGGPRASVFDEASAEVRDFAYGSRKLCLMHGDTVNLEDRRYLRWRAFSRGSFMKSLVRLLPGWLGRALARSAEKSMRGTNRQYKKHFPEGACQARALEVFEKGADTLIMGHFHEEHVFIHQDGSFVSHEGDRIKPGGSPLLGTLITMPMWLDTGRYLVLDESGTFEFKESPESI